MPFWYTCIRKDPHVWSLVIVHSWSFFNTSYSLGSSFARSLARLFHCRSQWHLRPLRNVLSSTTGLILLTYYNLIIKVKNAYFHFIKIQLIT